MDYAKNPKGTNYWRNRILKVAKDYTGEYKFAISCKFFFFYMLNLYCQLATIYQSTLIIAKDDFQHELNEYGLDFVGDKPVVLAREC